MINLLAYFPVPPISRSLLEPRPPEGFLDFVGLHPFLVGFVVWCLCVTVEGMYKIYKNKGEDRDDEII